MKITSLLFLFVFSLTLSQAQSPWVPGKGKGYAQLGFTTIGPYDVLYAKSSDYSLTREVADQTLQMYGEYGAGEKTSLIGILPFKFMHTGEQVPNQSPTIEEGSFSTIGNLALAVRQNFINDKIVFSGQFSMELPTAGFDENTGLRGGLDALSLVPSLSIGKGFEKFYGFLSAGVGIRTNEYSSDFRLAGEIGYQVVKRSYIVVVLDLVESFENGDVMEDSNQLETGLYLNNQSYFAYGLKAIIGFTDSVGINGAFYGAASGNLVAKAPSINFGIYYKW